MSTYIFILGKDANLSLAELFARYPDLKLGETGNGYAAIELNKKFVQEDLNQLGGVIKVGEVIVEAVKGDLLNKIFIHLKSSHKEGKLNYGISFYGWPERQLRPLLLSLKKEFKKAGISSRFANRDFKNISTAQSKGLRKKGIELIVARQGDHFFVAELVAVQDIDAYSKRDYEKPFRDMKVGMLPPKLAQIMISLTGVSGTIWDPFCGGGVLVMEGLLMNHPMLGSDISAETLEGARRNIEWLKREFGFSKKPGLFVHDATQVLEEKSFDAIATEGYLGPAFSRPPSAQQLRPLLDELHTLYTRFFSRLKEMDFKGPVVIALPYYRLREGQAVELSATIKAIQKMGFELQLNYKYARPDQAVGRMVCRFILT